MSYLCNLNVISVRAQILDLFGGKLTFVLPSMSQSFASMLAVREERGGHDASRLDKPRRGGGSRVSWKYQHEEEDAGC